METPILLQGFASFAKKGLEHTRKEATRKFGSIASPVDRGILPDSQPQMNLSKIIFTGSSVNRDQWNLTIAGDSRGGTGCDQMRPRDTEFVMFPFCHKIFRQ